MRVLLVVAVAAIRFFGHAAANPLYAHIASRADPIPPSQDPWYNPPDDFHTKTLGSVLRIRPVPEPIAAFGVISVGIVSAAYQILYTSSDTFGNPIATVTTVLVPRNADPGKLLSYQIATDAANVDCAPSYALLLGSYKDGALGKIITQAEFLIILAALHKGWFVTVPDFLGPRSAYLANHLSAKLTLDGIRATLNAADQVGLQRSARIALWGYSGGGVGSCSAAEYKEPYAPELNIVGIACGGTAPNILSALRTLHPAYNIFTGLTPPGIIGLSREYPWGLPIITNGLKPEKVDQYMAAEHRCLLDNGIAYVGMDTVRDFYIDPEYPFTQHNLTQIAHENNMGTLTDSPMRMPILMYKGQLDQVSIVADTDTLYDQYCARGASIEYYRGYVTEHGSTAVIGAPRALDWLTKRLSGQPQQPGCSREDVLFLNDPSTFTEFPPWLWALLEALLTPTEEGPITGGLFHGVDTLENIGGFLTTVFPELVKSGVIILNNAIALGVKVGSRLLNFFKNIFLFPWRLLRGGGQ